MCRVWVFLLLCACWVVLFVCLFHLCIPPADSSLRHPREAPLRFCQLCTKPATFGGQWHLLSPLFPPIYNCDVNDLLFHHQALLGGVLTRHLHCLVPT